MTLWTPQNFDRLILDGGKDAEMLRFLKMWHDDTGFDLEDLYDAMRQQDDDQLEQMFPRKYIRAAWHRKDARKIVTRLKDKHPDLIPDGFDVSALY